MTASLNLLIQALNTNRAVLEEMAGFLDQEREHVVALDAAWVEGEAAHKRELLTRLEEAAVAGKRQLQQVGQEMRLPRVEKVSDILPRLAGAEKAALQKVLKPLQELGAKVQRQMLQNSDLLENSLELVTDSLQFFNNMLTRRQTYGQQGMMMEGGSGICLVNKEI